MLRVIAPDPLEAISELAAKMSAAVFAPVAAEGAAALIVIRPAPPVVTEPLYKITPAWLSAAVEPPVPEIVMSPEALLTAEE